MSRSLKKGWVIDDKLYKKILKLKADSKIDAIVKTYARRSTVFPEMVGFKMEIHTGNKFKEVFIREEMVGHKLGEFAPTRKFKGHAKKGRLAKTYGFSGRFLQDRD